MTTSDYEKAARELVAKWPPLTEHDCRELTELAASQQRVHGRRTLQGPKRAAPGPPNLT